MLCVGALELLLPRLHAALWVWEACSVQQREYWRAKANGH